MGLLEILLAIPAGLIGLFAASFGVEALRPLPRAPATLSWAPSVAIEMVDIGGAQDGQIKDGQIKDGQIKDRRIKVRHIRTGSGPPLVLLHTLRTQLDIFAPVVAPLARHFTVHAFDYPGHGWSDIPKARYVPEDFYRWTAAYLDALGIRQATLAGMSIGATIALVLAARHNPRVANVVAINPYDYPPAGGIRHSSLAARLILGPSEVPLLGATIMRLRNRFVSDRIFAGGVACPDALTPALAQEFYAVGARRGHYQAFQSLLAHERRWREARKEYANIAVPTLLVYGEADWAPLAERQRTAALINGVATETITAASHFLSLERPQDMERLITQSARC